MDGKTVFDMTSDHHSCLDAADNDDGETFEVGRPIGNDQYPKAYLDQLDAWYKQIADVEAGSTDNGGTCHLDMTEIWTCEAVEKNLYARLHITDASGTTLYQTELCTSSPGVPINDKFPLHLKKVP
ncbi:hypothetical protein J3459_015870 [Metarhizium acridum]|nr:hypothetical protein J3459_016526 [Metarhizium acridum]KAG8412494.1 hypothetical protein J3459_015870 [Metarhizium acridum]